MMTGKLSSFPSPEKSRRAGEKELLLSCGDVVPLSGIYEFLHPSDDRSHESELVVAIRGERIQPCQSCGEQVQLKLVHAAPHISEDHDFCDANPESQEN